MVPTTRLVRFIALGSPLWLLSFVFPAAGWLAGIVYLLILGIVCVVDYRSMPDADAIEIEREFGRFSLGSATDVRVVLRNSSKQFLHITARDELPAGLQQVGAIPELHLPSHTEYEFA